MNKMTHKCGGVAFATFIVVILGGLEKISILDFIMLITGSSFGSILPDIDHKGSDIGRKLKPISKLVAKFTTHRGFTHSPLCAFLVCIVAKESIDFTKGYYDASFNSRVVLGVVSGFLIWVALDTALNSMRPRFIRNKNIRKLLDLEFPALVVLVFVCYLFSDKVYNSLDTFAFGISIGYISHIILDMFNPKGVPIFHPISRDKIHIANIKTGEHEKFVSLILNVITIYCLYKLFI